MTATVRPGRDVIRWRNAVLGVFAVSGFVMATWTSRVPGVRDLLHASTQEMGLIAFSIAAGSIVGLLVSSHLISRLSTTRAILWCFTAAGLGVVVAGLVASLVPTLAGLVIGLAVFGAGSSIVDVGMNLSGAANERALGRTVMPVFHAAFSIGTVAGAGVGALTIQVGVPLGVHVSTVGALAIVAVVVLVRFMQPAEAPIDPAATPVHAGWVSRLAVFRQPRILLIGVIVLGMAFAEGSANDWLALAMVDGHDVSNAQGAAIFGVFVAAMTVGRLAGTRLLDRFGRVPVLRVSAVAAALGLAVVILVPSTATAIVGVVIWGLGAALGFPVGMSAASDDPHTATASVAAVSTIGYLAFLVGPPVIGFLGQQLGLLHALVAVLVLVVAAGVASGAARPVGRTGVVGPAEHA